MPNPIILDFSHALYTAVLRWLDKYIQDGFVFGHSMGFDPDTDRIKVIAQKNATEKNRFDIYELNKYETLGSQVKVSIGYIKLVVDDENRMVSSIHVFIYDKIPFDQRGGQFMGWLAHNICNKFKLVDPSTQPGLISKPISPPEVIDKALLQGSQRQKMSKIEHAEFNNAINNSIEKTQLEIMGAQQSNISNNLTAFAKSQQENLISSPPNQATYPKWMPHTKKVLALWKRCYAEIIKMRKQYKDDYDDGKNQNPNLSNYEIQDRLIKIYGKRPSQKTVSNIMRAGKQGFLKKK